MLTVTVKIIENYIWHVYFSTLQNYLYCKDTLKHLEQNKKHAKNKTDDLKKRNG